MPITAARSPFESNAGLNSLGTLYWIAWALVLIGALNWGLLGLFGIDVLASTLGSAPMLSRIAYVIIGVAGVYCIGITFQEDLLYDKE